MASRPRRAVRTEERPPLRLVPGRGGSFRVAMIPAALVLIGAVFAVAAMQAYLAQEGFRAANLERSLRGEQERYALLRERRAELASPARLNDAARKLGMTEPADPSYLPAPAEVAEGSEASGPEYQSQPKHLLGGYGGR